jgi:hypothetical protein
MTERRSGIPSLERLLGRPLCRLVTENISGNGDVLFLQGNATRHEFLNCPALESIGALSRAFAGTDCFRVLPNRLDEASYGGGAAIDPKDAALFLNMGMSVWVRDLNELPFFRDLEKRWADEIGLSPDRLYSQLFVSPPGARTLRHFDVSQNLVLQLRGTKRWTVAPYNSEANGYPDRESELIPDHTPLPGQRILDVEAGDLVCLPFCWWHSTEALTESWSLTVFLRAPTWKFLVGQLILARLQTLSGVWGQPIIGLKNGIGLEKRLTQQLAGLLADIPQLTQGLAPDRARTVLEELIQNRDVSDIKGWRLD